ncbi:MAG TPA: 6-bladed beta-propeller [Longimicrobiales bacterium]|nr:6-bladed beta-propeller [Longimicrobiales bacterium]
MPSAFAQSIRDSARVTVITYAPTDSAPQWRIDARPELVIGTRGGPATSTFSNITNAFRLADGTIVVGDMDSRQIRMFDSDGAHMRTIGREGGGPGEFRSLWRVWRESDRILGLDGSGRIHAFRFDGEYLETAQPLVSSSGARIRPHGFLANGVPIGSFLELAPDVPTGRSLAAGTLVKVMAGDIVPLARYPSHVVIKHPGQRPTHLVYGPEAVVGVLPDRVCIGYPRAYEFHCFDEGGRLRTITRRENWPSRTVTEGDREIYFAGIDQANPGERGASYRQQVRETTDFASELPAYGRFVVASETGELWIGPMIPQDQTLGLLNVTSDEPTRWSVFSPDGLWLSEIVLPGRFHLTDAGSNYVLGVSRDEFDIERIVMFRLLRN